MVSGIFPLMKGGSGLSRNEVREELGESPG